MISSKNIQFINRLYFIINKILIKIIQHYNNYYSVFDITYPVYVYLYKSIQDIIAFNSFKIYIFYIRNYYFLIIILKLFFIF